MKRLLDVSISFLGLALVSPLILTATIFIWIEDQDTPFYIAPRVGINGKIFKMVKLRSMTNKKMLRGVNSTASNDPRITRVGAIIRRTKLDELMQLWNVLEGNMSLVGPRPNVPQEVNLYTSAEALLLTVKPGITDFSSIVFSDEGVILERFSDPDLAYHQLIRPWKSRLGLLYIKTRSFSVDLVLIFLTIISLFSRRNALDLMGRFLRKLGAPKDLVNIAMRNDELQPYPPPGMLDVICSDDLQRQP